MDVKNKVFEFAENHPYILLAIISVLVIIVIVMYLNSRGYGIGGMQGFKKKRKEPLNDEEEVDELIDSIHKKQRAKRG